MALAADLNNTIDEITSEQPLFGIENELEFNNKFLPHRSGALSFIRSSPFTCEIGHDGSLATNDGIEIRSLPATWPAWLNNKSEANKLWDLRKFGFYSSDMAGMHVHTSMLGVPNVMRFNMARFVFQNPVFSRFVSGRRTDSGYATVINRPSETVTNLSRIKRGYNHTSRVCVSMNDIGTMEFRLFTGTVKKSQFWRAIEYVVHLREIAECHGDSEHVITMEEFIDTVDKREMPNLNRACYLYNQDRTSIKDYKEVQERRIQNLLHQYKCPSHRNDPVFPKEEYPKYLNLISGTGYNEYSFNFCPSCILKKDSQIAA